MGFPGKQTQMEISMQAFTYSQEQYLQRKDQKPSEHKKSSCDSVSGNPTGVLKLGMALQSRPELGQGDQDLMPQYRPVIGCGLLPRERVTLTKMALCSPGRCPEKAYNWGCLWPHFQQLGKKLLQSRRRSEWSISGPSISRGRRIRNRNWLKNWIGWSE